MRPEPLQKNLVLPRVDLDRAFEPGAVTYQLLELPLFITDDHAFTWQRLQSLLTKDEAQLYASWANEVWAERARLA